MILVGRTIVTLTFVCIVIDVDLTWIRYQVGMKAIEFARWLLSARRVWTADSESGVFIEIKRKPKEDE